jgi:hypothetical protein
MKAFGGKPILQQDRLRLPSWRAGLADAKVHVSGFGSDKTWARRFHRMVSTRFLSAVRAFPICNAAPEKTVRALL